MTRILFLLFWITLVAGCASTGVQGPDVARNFSTISESLYHNALMGV